MQVTSAGGAAAIEPVEDPAGQGRNQLPGPVFAEVKRDQGIPRLESAVGANDARMDELIALTGRVSGGDGRLGGGRGPPLAQDDGTPGALDPLPAAVAIHGEEAPADRCDGAAGAGQGVLDLGKPGHGRTRRGIPTVRDHVQQRSDLVFRAQLDQGQEVADMAVHTAVGDQAQQVQRPAFGRCGEDRAHQGRVGQEGLVGDGIVDEDQVLAHDASAAQGEVPHLGITHLTVGQANPAPGGVEDGERITEQVLVEPRGTGRCNGIVQFAWVDPEAVHDHKDDRVSRDLALFSHHALRWCKPIASARRDRLPETEAIYMPPNLQRRLHRGRGMLAYGESQG
jgi:hypothetical protein